MRLFRTEQGHRGAIGEYRANGRFPKRVDGSVGVSRRIDDVAPIEQRRDAGVDLVECSDQIADIDVLRRIEANDLADQHTEIVVQCPVRRDTAECGLPEVDVSVDETRHGNHAAAVDLDRRPTADVAADGNNLTVVNQQVAALDDFERRIHRYDSCAFNSYP